MDNYVDIAIAVIFLFMMVEGWIKGLVRSIIGIIGYIAAFIIAKFYYVDMADFLTDRFEWFQNLKVNISDSIMASFSGNAQLEQALASGSHADLSKALENKEVLDQLDLPTLITDRVSTFAQSVDIANTQRSAVEGLAELIANGILYGISFMLVVLLVLVTVKFIGLILDGATEVPIIKQANKLGGLIFGAVKACFFIFLIMATVVFIAPLTPEMNVIETINASTVGVYFYNNNILLILLDIFLN